MWLVAVNVDTKNGVVSEYDILLNTDQIKEIRPRRDGTCMVMYSDPEQNIIVKHGLPYFRSHLVTHDAAKTPQVRERIHTSANEVLLPDPVVEPPVKLPPAVVTKPFVPKGTTSGAINQG